MCGMITNRCFYNYERKSIIPQPMSTQYMKSIHLAHGQQAALGEQDASVED